MTDYTLNLVDAIISGKATDIETAFQEAITDKISIAMETRKTEIAQSMFTKESVELDESAINAAKKEKPELFPKDDESLFDYKKRMSDKRIASAEKNKAFIKKTFAKEEVEELTLEDYSLEELEEYMMSEDFEQLDEISKATLGSYVKKASGKLASHGTNLMGSVGNFDIKNAEYHGTKIDKRQKGISKAIDKLTK